MNILVKTIFKGSKAQSSVLWQNPDIARGNFIVTLGGRSIMSCQSYAPWGSTIFIRGTNTQYDNYVSERMIESKTTKSAIGLHRVLDEFNKAKV